jgi:dienelactone hydrolase
VYRVRAKIRLVGTHYLRSLIASPPAGEAILFAMRCALAIFLILCPIVAAQQKPTLPVPGQADLHRVCANKQDQTYALYLPSSYTPAKKWPIVYAFDPSARGERPIDTFKAAAEKYGYIVAASNNSRNGPWPPEIEAAQAMSDDTHTLLSIDDHRVYFTGFSGGSRVAAQIALDCKCAAGVYLNGAGFPLNTAPSPKDPFFPVFAVVGNIDFNFPEVTHLDELLAAAGYSHFLRYFEGPHQWAPPEVAEEALVWFRLLAMKKDVAPRDAEFIAQQRDAEVARARSFEQSGNPFYALREYNQAAATFDGLIDVAPLRAAAASLASQKDVREGRKRQQRDFDEQQDLVADITGAMRSLPTLTADVAATVSATKQKIANLRDDASHEKKPDKAIVLKRAVAQVYVHAMETGSEQIDQKQYVLARDYYVLAVEAMPDSPIPIRNLALVQALGNNRKAALESLRQAKLKATDVPRFLEWLQSEPAFTQLRDDPAFKALLAQ